MRNQLLLLLASFAFGISAAWAQSVSGKVTDSSNGEGLPGVAVVVEGSNTGVMSDMDGVYRINGGTEVQDSRCIKPKITPVKKSAEFFSILFIKVESRTFRNKISSTKGAIKTTNAIVPS